MLPDVQRIIDDGLKDILGKVLQRNTGDSTSGWNQATDKAESEYAVEICNAIVKSAVSLQNDQTRIRNELVPHINQLPPELLCPIWKESITARMEYYVSLTRIRHTSSFWNDIVLSDPSFWTVFNCSDHPELLQLSLERSKYLPLQIYFPCTSVPLSDKEREEEGDQFVRQTHTSHEAFLQLLDKHTPSRGVSRLHFAPMDADWSRLYEFLTSPTPFLTALTIDYKERGSSDGRPINLGHLNLSAGAAPRLQVLDLAACRIPTQYPPLPNLRSCMLSHCCLSRDDIVQLITAAPALSNLSLMKCMAVHARESAGPFTATLHTRIRDLCIQDDPRGPISIISALDYIQAPDLEIFDVRVGQIDVINDAKPRISEWISSFTERRHSTISTLKVRIQESFFADFETIFMELEPNFKIGIVHTAQSTETQDEVILQLINAIHPSAYPSITTLEIQLKQPLFDIVIPALAFKFTATEELVIACNARQSWLFLGQKRDADWPFPRLQAFRIAAPMFLDRSGDSFLDMIRARQATDGPPRQVETIHTSRYCEVGYEFLTRVRELGVTMKVRE